MVLKTIDLTASLLGQTPLKKGEKPEFNIVHKRFLCKQCWLAIVYKLNWSIDTIIRQTILTYFAIVVGIKGSACSCMHTLQLISFFELISYDFPNILSRSSVNIHWIQECDIASDFQLSCFLLVFFVFSVSVLFSVRFFHLIPTSLAIGGSSCSYSFCSCELISELKDPADCAYSSVLSDFCLVVIPQ